MQTITTEIKVGIFVVIAIVFLGYMTVRIGDLTFGRDTGYLVYGVFDSVAGLDVKAPVKMAGVAIGSVETIGLDDSRAKVGMRINPGIKIKKGVVAAMKTESLLGERYVELLQGDKEVILNDGDVIEKSISVADIDSLITKLDSVASDIKSISGFFSETLGAPETKRSINEIIINMRNLTASLSNIAERDSGAIEKVISDLKAHRSLRNYEVLLKRGDGTPFWVSLSSELITFTDEPCVLTGFYDITVRKRVEKRERVITQGLRAVVESADELLGYDDLDTIYRRAVELAREKLKVERCAIFLLDTSKEHLWGTYGTDIHGGTTDERWLQISAAQHTEKFKAGGPKWHTHLENQQTTIENKQLKVLGVGWAVTTVIRTTAGPLGVFINDAAISNAALDEATQESLAIYCSLLGQIIESKLAEKAIQESLKEKEVLIKEVHHRVKNNMQVIVSMINLQSGYITDSKALEIFHDTQHRVRAMALVHEKLYQSNNLAQIDFRDYIEHLASSLFHSYSPQTSRVTLRVDIGDVALSVDSAIPCGLIVNELISNALKYAFPDNRQGELIVRLREADAGRIEMSIEDDGIGFPQKLDFRNTESLGMQLVHSLARQLSGTLDLDRDHGTKFTLRFPTRTGK